MHIVMVSRGSLLVCEICYSYLTREHLITGEGRSVGDRVIEDLCLQCYDHNKPLIDDILGSSE